jgi:putative PIN family toxin of toxin-antitoxin system
VSRIVVDTNIWISFLISGSFARIENVLRSQSAILLVSAELLDEFVSVASRPRLTKYFDRKDFEWLFSQLLELGESVHVISEVAACRDPKDNFLLALSRDGHADYLITGDTDLLMLQQFESTQIITLTHFLERFGNG